VSVPQGTNLSQYQWMMMQSPRPLGSSQVQITDSLAGGLPHLIAWDTLPRTGNQVFARVGSCLQWHWLSHDQPDDADQRAGHIVLGTPREVDRSVIGVGSICIR
jgi:hypothetical protein